MAESVRVNSYLKNLGKSIGYISVDVFKSYAPVMSSLASTTKEAATTGYQAIKDFSSSSGGDSDFSFKGIKNKSGQVIDNLWTNIKDDLKSGKIYNKERSDALGNEIASGFLGDDFNFDFDFDDDWGDDDESSSEDAGAKAQVAAEMQSTKAIVSAVDAMGKGISASMTEATVESASYIASSARENSAALFNLNKEGFSSITKSLMSINETIYGFSKIGEPLTAHMQNSSLFFTKTTESLNNIEQSLKQIEQNTKPAPVAGSKGYKAKRSLGTMMSDDEGINFSELIDSFKETIDDYKGLASMFVDMFKPTAKSGGKNISPLSVASVALTKKLIPKAFSDAIKDLDESIKYGLGAGLTKISTNRSGKGGGLVDILLDMFMPSRDIKNGISTSSYEKGAVQWDGIARKALTDVIPTTLLQIYSVLSGTEPMRFDYQSGKFVKASSISAEFKKKKEGYVKESGGDFYKQVLKSIKDSGKSDKDQEKMMEEAYKFFEYAFDNTDHRISNNANIDPATFAMIQNVVKTMRSGNGKNRRAINKWSVEANKQAANFANWQRSEEASGFSTYQMIHKEFAGEGAKKGTRTTIIGLDEYGHNYYFYLQGIWQSTRYMADNWNGPASTDQKSPRIAELPPIEPAFEEVAGEKTTQQANEDVIPGSDDSEEAAKAKEVDSISKRFKDWVKTNVSDRIQKRINKVFGKDIDYGKFSAIGIINSVSTAIDTLIWGTEENPEKGLFSYMFDKAKSMFDDLREAFKTKILDRFKDWFNREVGEKWKNSEFVKDTKETLKRGWDKFKGRTNEIVFGNEDPFTREEYFEEVSMNPPSARGRKVTKTGLVTVSEGELIIPSQFNPYYHGATNKISQINRENYITRKFLGNFANGNIEYYGRDGDRVAQNKAGRWFYVAGSKNHGLAKKSDVVVRHLDGSWADLNGNPVDTPDFIEESQTLEGLTGAQDVAKDKTYQKKSKITGFKKVTNNSVLGVIKNAAIDAFAKLKQTITDSVDEKKLEEDKKKISNGISKALGEIGGAKGEIGAGAIMGVGASILTGAVLGPIAGAALGASIGFISKSEAAQDFLFGPEDENGKRKHQKVYDFFKKELPTVGVGAGLGAAAGLFMGSPIIGAFVGAAGGFMVSSNSFKNWLFGEQEFDENGKSIGRKGGAIPNKLQEKIKKALPGITAGAVLGAIATPIAPIGIVGNILLGSSLGFSASVGRLNESLFGGDNVKKEESLVFIIKEKIFGGIDNIFHNMNNRFKIWSKELAKHIRDKLSDKIDKIKLNAKEGKGGIGTKLLGGFFNSADWILDKTVKVPVKAVAGLTEKIDKKIRRTNLKKGYGTWNRKEKRNMTAQERINARSDLRIKLKGKDFEKFDDFLSSIKDFSELTKFKDLIYTIKTEQPGSAAYEAAVEELINSDKWKEYMKDTSVDFLKKNINRLSGLVSDESKRKGLSKEETETKWEQDNHNNIETITNTLQNGVRVYLSNVFDNDKKKNNKFDELSGDDDINKFFGLNDNKNDESDNEASDPAVVTDSDGKVTGKWVSTLFGLIKYKITNKGLEPDNDKVSSVTMDKVNGLFSSIKNIPSKIGSVFGKLFGTEEDENGNPKESILTKAKNWISDKLKSAGKFITKILLPIGAAVGTIIALVNSFLGKQSNFLNNAANTVGAKVGLGGNPSENSEEGNGGPNDKGGTKTQFQTADGRLVTVIIDKNGNRTYVDENGNPVDPNSIMRNQAGQKTLINNFRTGTVTQIARGQKTLAGTLLDIGTKPLRNNISKIPGVNLLTNQIGTKFADIKSLLPSIKDEKFAQKITDMALEDASSATQIDDAFKTNILYTKVRDILDDILKHKDFIPVPEKVKAKLPNCFDDLLDYIEKNAPTLSKKAGNTAAFLKDISDMLPIINYVMMGVDFHTGYEDARTTLKITAEPTVGQRIACGLLRLLKNLIPIIGPFIPDDTAMEILLKYIGPLYKVDPKALREQQEQAKSEVEAYNKEHGTNYNVAEYNKSVLNDYTLTERFGNVFKTIGQQGKDKISGIKNAYKQAGGGLEGLKAGLNEWIGLDSVTKAYNEAGGGIQGFFEATKTGLNNAGPGILGEIPSKVMSMIQSAFNGDIKGLWSINLDAFSKTNDKQANVNVLTQTMCSNIFTMGKLILFPVAMVSNTIRRLTGTLDETTDGLKNVFANIDDTLGVTNAIEAFKEGSVAKLINFTSGGSDDSGFVSTVKNIASIPVKMAAIVPVMVSEAGHKIGEAFVSMANKIKQTSNIYKAGFEAGFTSIMTGGEDNGEAVWDMVDEEGNPLSGFQTAVVIVGRMAGLATGGFFKVGRFIVDKIKGLFTKAKNSVVTIGKTSMQNMQAVVTGDPAALWNGSTVQADPDNPVGGFTEGALFAQKIALTPVAALAWVGKKAVLEPMLQKMAIVRAGIDIVKNRSSELMAYVDAGDPVGLAIDEMEIDDANPVKGLLKGIDYGTKFVMFPLAAVVHGATIIGDNINKVKATTTNAMAAIGQNQLSIQQYVDKGDYKGIWNVDTDFSGSPLSGVAGGVDFTMKLVNTPVAIYNNISNSVGNMIDRFTNGIKQDINSMKTYYDNIMKLADNGSIDQIISNQYKSSGGILGGIFKFAAGYIQIAAILKGGIEWFGDSFKDILPALSENVPGAKYILGGKTKDKDKKSASGSGLSINSTNCDTCSNYVSQLDDRYRNIPFAGSTIGENGCGPAVGAMVSSSMGSNIGMDKAISDARPYTTSSGTSIKYFKDKFNASELKNVNTVQSALENNRPVILLGRDPSNKSKVNSPFGPNNHYVLATSMKKGKVLVYDPENNTPMAYDKSILNKSSVNLTYGGFSRLRGKGNVNKGEVSDAVWNILKGEGFSDAAAAGILGNIQQESSFNTAANGAAYGLYQFEKNVGNEAALEEFAKSIGKPKDDLETQTKFMLSKFASEITSYSGHGTSTYPNGTVTWWPDPITYDEFKALTDPALAAEIYERTYERPSMPMRENRKDYAKQFYEIYSGTPYTGSSGSSSVESSTGSSGSTSGGLLSILSSIFGSISNIFNIKDGFSLNSDGSSSSSSGSFSGKINGTGAAAAAQAAENELGYPEQGDNITKFGEWSGCNGQPWCAAFAAWAISQAFDGSKDSAVKALYGCDNVNYTPTLTDYFKGANAWFQEPEVGDEVMYGNPGPYHVGIVTAVDKNAKTFTSVEGNTNDAVNKKEHSSYLDGNVIGFGRPDYSGATATVASNGNNGSALSGDEDFKATGSGLRGGSSGLLRKAAPSRFAYGSLKGQRFSFGGASGLVSKNRFSGAGSDVTKTVTRTLTNLKRNLTGGLANNGYSKGSIDAGLVEELLVSITALLNNINNNTAPTQQIYEALKEYIDYVKGNKSNTAATNQVAMPTENSDVDTNFANLVTTLAAIARG